MDDITPGLPIICADDLILRSVEGVEDEYLVTTPLEDGRRHFIPLDLVDDAVYLTVNRDELAEYL
jgi:hypothetical protein